MATKDDKSLNKKIEEAYKFHGIISPVEFVLKGMNITSKSTNSLIQKLTQYSNLKIESISIIIYLLHTNPNRVKLPHGEQSENPFTTELKQILNCNNLTDEAIESFVFNYANILQTLHLIDFKVFYTGIYKQINEKIELLYDEVPLKYKFIKTFNKTELGNFFKAYNSIVNEHKIEPTIKDEIANIKLLVEYIKKPKGVLSAPILKDTINQLKLEHLNDYSLDFFDMNELEFLNYKILYLKQGELIRPEFIELLKGCFKFNNKNSKGLAKFLYEIFSIIHKDELPNYSQWKDSLKEKESNDNVKAWTHYRQRAINKIIQIDYIFN